MEKLSDWNKEEKGDLSGLFDEGEIANNVLGKKQAGEHKDINEPNLPKPDQSGSPESPAKNEVVAENSNLTQLEIDEFTKEVAAEQKMRQLTPEIVSSAWESLNHFEKRFVTSPQEQFDKFIDRYEASHSTKRRHLITGLRKLIESGNRLASEIKPEPKWEKKEAKEEEKEKIAA
ncbi:MAG: hypothetical protein AAB863_03460 [Patescibacteria group bacterium]